MAKIYQTKEDFERERLGKEAGSARESQNYFLQTGLLSTLLGSANITAGGLYNEIKELKVAEKPSWLSRNMGRFYYGIGLAFAALGIAEIIASFSSRNRAKKAEDTLAKLGPEQIIIPPEMCTNCSPNKAYTQSIEPKTLLEQTEKSTDSMKR